VSALSGQSAAIDEWPVSDVQPTFAIRLGIDIATSSACRDAKIASMEDRR